MEDPNHHYQKPCQYNKYQLLIDYGGWVAIGGGIKGWHVEPKNQYCTCHNSNINMKGKTSFFTLPC